MQRGRAWAITLSSVVLVTIAACSATGGQPASGGLLPTGTPTVSAVPNVPDVQGLALPIAAYVPTAGERTVIVNAEDTLTQQCMTDFGFTWSTTTYRAPAAIPMDRRYGIGNAATAAAYGYHFVPGDPNAPQTKPAAGAPDPAAELLVLTGDPSGNGDASSPARSYGGKTVPRGGCQGQARVTVTSVDQLDTDLVDAVNVGMFNRSKQDARVVAATTRWSACMRRSGYDYADPAAAFGPFSPVGPVSQAELQQATTDLACKRSTNLIGIWFTVESAYENQAIQQNIQQLTAIRDRWRGAAAKAAGILGVAVPR